LKKYLFLREIIDENFSENKINISKIFLIKVEIYSKENILRYCSSFTYAFKIA
jgi:hypothetical protein